MDDEAGSGTGGERRGPGAPRLVSINAVTLGVADMARSVAFYTALGFRTVFGGAEEAFTSLEVGESRLNLGHLPAGRGGASKAPWGRVIFWVSDVDAFYRRALESGIAPHFAPRDAAWGERYFHVTDPDGHELSFARPLDRDEESSR